MQNIRRGQHHFQVARQAIHRPPCFPGQLQHLFGENLVQVQFQGDVRRPRQPLPPPAGQHIRHSLQIRHLGNRTGQLTLFIHDGQPHAHAAFRHFRQKRNIHAGRRQTASHILANPPLIDAGQQTDRNSHPGNIFRHIPAHAAMHEFHRADVPPQRHVFCCGKTLAVDKNRSGDPDLN